ncbi:MAG TPA: protein kinase [Polyangiaceae bacterium]
MHAGDLVDRRFQIEEFAGAGGCGSVFRARDLSTGERVGLKLLNAHSTAVERFAREVSILAELQHDAIVRYVAHGITEQATPYLAMEWLEGTTLSRALSARERLTPAAVLNLLLQICDALAVAHARGVVHRDVKPSNLFLVNHDLERLKLLDFGLARFTDVPDDLTTTGVIVGTPGYMAPEQVRGDDEVGPAADVFSLGCVVYECLTGRPAFRGRHPTATFSKILMEPAPRVRDSGVRVSGDLDALVQRMLAKDPARRPPDARAIQRETSLLLAHERRTKKACGIPPSLTQSEQGLLCVLMTRVDHDAGNAIASTSHERFPARQRLRAVALKYGGRVDFLSNGLSVIVFEPSAGVPLAATDLANRAAQCALALRRLLPSAPLALGTGSGRAGADSPVGEVLDRVAELLDAQVSLQRSPPDAEATHPRSAIRVDAATASLLESRFRVVLDCDGGCFLVGTKRTGDSGRLLLGKPTACVGRDRELSTLETLLDACVEERSARVVLITAPAGHGKSRLRYEFTRRLPQRAQTIGVWQAWGEATRAGSPLSLVAEMVRRTLPLEEGEPLEIAREKVRKRVAGVVAAEDATRVSSFLGELVGIDFGDSAQLRAARRDSRLMGDQIARAWHDFLAGECARTPVLLIVEDMHWADPGSLKLIDSALRQLADHPLIVLALGRPEAAESFPELWRERGLVHLSLPKLSQQASAELVTTVLGAAVSPEVVQRIVQHSDGNAFYLEELIRAEAQGGSGELPPTVLAMLQARLARLSPESRQLLRAGSVFGETFWDGGVAVLSPANLPGPVLHKQLQALVRAEWLVARPESRLARQCEYAFCHALLRDTAYASLTDEDRALGHGLAGAWLERSGERDPVLLAEHFRRAGELPRAASWYERAAALALKADFESAIQHAERAIECGAGGALLGRLRLIQTEAHNWRGEHAAAARTAAEALQLLDGAGNDAERWAHAVNQSNWANGCLANHEEITRWSRALLERACERSTDLHVLALTYARTHLIEAGNTTDARKILAWLDEHAQERSEDPLVAAAVNMMSGFEHLGGNLSEALHRFEVAGKHLEQAQDDRQLKNAVMNAGAACETLGEYERAESAFGTALALAERLGADTQDVLVNMALTRARLGVPAEARQILDELLAKRVQGNPRVSSFAHALVAELLIDCGELAAAIENARSALNLENVPLQAFALCVLSRAQLALGRAAEALDSARSAVALADSGTHICEHERRVRLTYAEALHASGERDAARSAIQSARITLHEAATLIEDRALRHSFLTRVPENVRILALASAWLDE